MRIVFHGRIAAPFSEGFSELLSSGAKIALLPDELTTNAQRQTYAAADVIVSFRFDASLPHPQNLKLLHMPGAGYDGVDFSALPSSAVVCNGYGHEHAIAEYVMAALLIRHVPLIDADRTLRQGQWLYRAGSGNMHDEVAEKTIGLLGYGHIGQAIAARAKAFAMRVHVANRSAVPTSPLVDRSFRLDDIIDFCGSADFIVVSLPLAEETRGIVGSQVFASMRPTAVLVNVGRGPTVDEQALFDALQNNRIAGAIIDTWYNYPSKESPTAYPSALPFHELPNVLMTPHMSAWTRGTLRRRQRTIAENIERRMRGDECINVVRPSIRPDYS